MTALETFIRDASRLPVLPEVTARVLALADAPDSSAKEMARAVESDPALSVRLLKLANSGFYGQRGHIATPTRAVVVLGFKTIRSLALAVWTHALRSPFSDPQERGLMQVLLAHGLATGVAAGLLAARVQRPLEEDAFMAGLLHDIGRVALLSQMGPAYRALVLAPAEGAGRALHEAEREVLGFDHRDLGAALMSAWGLPPFLGDVAAGHHDGDLVPRDRFFVASAALADALAPRLAPCPAPALPRRPREDLAPFFGLESPESLEPFLQACGIRLLAFREILA
ncbi:MAG: HDOD domain-containing protein [Acidobacteria bacterium]|nr:HDOD domain-containing protein [Acidobacteriota bacterium]